MMNDQEPPKCATASALRRVKLTAQDSEHVHPGVWLALDENGDIVAVHLDAARFLDSNRVGLVRSLLQHGRKTEKLALGWLVDDHFLLIVVHGGNANLAGNHNVGVAAGVAHFINALARGEGFDLHLAAEDGEFVFIEEREQRDGAERFGTGTHRSTSWI
jgi:hypothetical protein